MCTKNTAPPDNSNASPDELRCVFRLRRGQRQQQVKQKSTQKVLSEDRSHPFAIITVGQVRTFHQPDTGFTTVRSADTYVVL